MIEIPLTNEPEQIFSIDLGGVVYQLRVALNYRLGLWSISFRDETGEPIVQDIGLCAGVDILDPYNLPFQDAYVVNTANVKLDPTRENLGEISKLVVLEDGDI